MQKIEKKSKVIQKSAKMSGNKKLESKIKSEKKKAKVIQFTPNVKSDEIS